MRKSLTDNWLEIWGYQNSKGSLYKLGSAFSDLYAYRTEVTELLDPEGDIRASAVFDVDGVPTVCFIEASDDALSDDYLQKVREKIWNQNIISIVLVLGDDNATCVPVAESNIENSSISYSEASEKSYYSLADISSGDIYDRHPEWFSSNNNVDHHLLRNMRFVVSELEKFGILRERAQYMMAQILFVSYLEHRGIIGDSYRERHGLDTFTNLVERRNNVGIKKLFTQLKKDLNGDFLEPTNGYNELWDSVSSDALSVIANFLAHIDLESGQTSLLRYDFRYIPVELISGIYESFLLEMKKNVGAFYTPRNLANFVIDQAFSTSKDIESELIYDGACGSGILLTTAYRRLISYKEQVSGKKLGFIERSKMLKNQIFGSDINPSACRVTAFSLYLSLLEGILPSDISELQSNQSVKLPTLSGTNILGGPDIGDFFSKKNTLASSNKFSLFLSNPPWLEPPGGSLCSGNVWAKEMKHKLPRRQLATAFMLRAKDCLNSEGRFCFILPISAIAAHTSREFVGEWLKTFKVQQVINFGDFRKLLFPTAKSPCVISLGNIREGDEEPNLSKETFEYWVPKADVSFAFGRLTLHSSDRHKVSTFSIAHDNSLFSTLFWGNDKDVANITDLRMKGKLGSYIGKGRKWTILKGFHKHDSSREPVSSKPLHSMRHLDAKKFQVNSPKLSNYLLEDFPEHQETVANISDKMLFAFKNPKIVFTDGVTHDRNVKAAYSEEEFSFSSSIGAITGAAEDKKIFKFIATYLHSKLSRYILTLTAYQYNFERERVTLTDIKNLPFIHPNDHENSQLAWSIVDRICDVFDAQKDHDFDLTAPNSDISNNFDDLIFEYFGLSSLQISRIFELSELVAPNIQPNSLVQLRTPLTSKLNSNGAKKYATALQGELLRWRDLRGGSGALDIDVQINSKSIPGAIGIVRIQPSNKNLIKTKVNDEAVKSLLSVLMQNKLLPMKVTQQLFYAADAIVMMEGAFYLIKPLTSRFWFISEAYRDSEKVISKLTAMRKG